MLPVSDLSRQDSRSSITYGGRYGQGRNDRSCGAKLVTYVIVLLFIGAIVVFFTPAGDLIPIFSSASNTPAEVGSNVHHAMPAVHVSDDISVKTISVVRVHPFHKKRTLPGRGGSSPLEATLHLPTSIDVAASYPGGVDALIREVGRQFNYECDEGMLFGLDGRRLPDLRAVDEYAKDLEDSPEHLRRILVTFDDEEFVWDPVHTGFSRLITYVRQGFEEGDIHLMEMQTVHTHPGIFHVKDALTEKDADYLVWKSSQQHTEKSIRLPVDDSVSVLSLHARVSQLLHSPPEFLLQDPMEVFIVRDGSMFKEFKDNGDAGHGPRSKVATILLFAHEGVRSGGEVAFPSLSASADFQASCKSGLGVPVQSGDAVILYRIDTKDKSGQESFEEVGYGICPPSDGTVVVARLHVYHTMSETVGFNDDMETLDSALQSIAEGSSLSHLAEDVEISEEELGEAEDYDPDMG